MNDLDASLLGGGPIDGPIDSTWRPVPAGGVVYTEVAGTPVLWHADRRVLHRLTPAGAGLWAALDGRSVHELSVLPESLEGADRPGDGGGRARQVVETVRRLRAVGLVVESHAAQVAGAADLIGPDPSGVAGEASEGGPGPGPGPGPGFVLRGVTWCGNTASTSDADEVVALLALGAGSARQGTTVVVEIDSPRPGVVGGVRADGHPVGGIVALDPPDRVGGVCGVDALDPVSLLSALAGAMVGPIGSGDLDRLAAIVEVVPGWRSPSVGPVWAEVNRAGGPRGSGESAAP